MTRPSSAPSAKRQGTTKTRANPIWMNAPSSRQVQQFSGHTKGRRVNYIGPKDAVGAGAGRRRPNGRKNTR